MIPLLESCSERILRTPDELKNIASTGWSVRIQTVNLHHLALAKGSAKFRRVIEQADYVTADGWPVVSALRSIGVKVERVTGADLILEITNFGVGQHLRLGILGCTELVADQWSQMLSEVDIQLCYRQHGDKSSWLVSDMMQDLRAAELDLLVVAVTPPFGDQIASEIADAGFLGTILPVGGAIDMVVCPERRAPVFLQKVGLEWAYRMLREPRRLGRRYLIECVPVVIFDLLPSILRGKIRGFRTFQWQLLGKS